MRRAGRSHGLRAPEDVFIIGFDDIPLAQHVVPALTTVAQPMVEMGRLAVTLLLERIQSKTERWTPRRIVLEPHLIVRESCRAWRETDADA